MKCTNRAHKRVFKRADERKKKQQLFSLNCCLVMQVSYVSTYSMWAGRTVCVGVRCRRRLVVIKGPAWWRGRTVGGCKSTIQETYIIYTSPIYKYIENVPAWSGWIWFAWWDQCYIVQLAPSCEWVKATWIKATDPKPQLIPDVQPNAHGFHGSHFRPIFLLIL